MTRSHKIGWFVLILAVLFMLWRLPRLHGQGFGSFSHDQPYLAADRTVSSWTPEDTTNFYWWVASDLSTGAVSAWPDRMHSATFTSTDAAVQPSQDTNGVYFDLVDMLTNSPGFPSALADGNGQNAIWFIVKWTGTEGTRLCVLGQNKDVAGNPSPFYGFYPYGFDADRRRVDAIDSQGNQLNTTATTTVDTWYDILIVAATNGVLERIFINGVHSGTSSSGFGLTGNSASKSDYKLWLFSLGENKADGLGFHGYIREVCWMMQPKMLADEGTNFAVRLHTYRTNTYGGSP